jgi:hypothetical protein
LVAEIGRKNVGNSKKSGRNRGDPAQLENEGPLPGVERGCRVVAESGPDVREAIRGGDTAAIRSAGTASRLLGMKGQRAMAVNGASHTKMVVRATTSVRGDDLSPRR